MARLSNLAQTLSNCDALALTGDSVKRPSMKLPPQWNQFPQRLKLSVPGHHDSYETFVGMSNWVYRTPWFVRHNDLVFLGIDTSSHPNDPFSTLEDQLEPFWEKEIAGVSGVFVKCCV
jgi:hypothetical protein